MTRSLEQRAIRMEARRTVALQLQTAIDELRKEIAFLGERQDKIAHRLEGLATEFGNRETTMEKRWLDQLEEVSKTTDKNFKHIQEHVNRPRTWRERFRYLFMGHPS